MGALGGCALFQPLIFKVSVLHLITMTLVWNNVEHSKMTGIRIPSHILFGTSGVNEPKVII